MPHRRAACSRARGQEVNKHDATHSLQCLQRADHRRVLRADGARPVAHSQPVRGDQFRPWRLPGDRRLSRLHAHALHRFLGRAGGRAHPDRDLRPDHRALSDPPAVRPRSALQPAADLRACLHVRGRHPLHLGGADPALCSAGLAVKPAQRRLFLPHRLPTVHGGAGDAHRGRCCSSS